MGSNETGAGRESLIFAAAFFLGFLIAEQHHEQEIARLRDANRAAHQQTIHLMTLMRGRDDKS